jgi:hypothetical protein
MYQCCLKILEGLLCVVVGIYCIHNGFIALTEHPTLMIGRFHHTRLNFEEYPGRDLFSATLTGLGGVCLFLWGIGRLFRSVFERPW